MKKVISFLLLLILMCGIFSACGESETFTETSDQLQTELQDSDIHSDSSANTSSTTEKTSSITTTDKPSSGTSTKTPSTATTTPSSNTTTNTNSKFTTINIPAIPQKPKTVAAITQKSTAIGKAQFVIHKGNLTQKKQLDTYTFTAPRNGVYRFQLSQMQNDLTIFLHVNDSSGKRIASTSGSNAGTTAELIEGKTYTIECEQGYDELGTYTLSIGQQKPTVDISAYTLVNDSVEFTDQINLYTFTAPRDGIYRFQLSQMQSDLTIFLHVNDSSGKRIASTSGSNAGTTAELIEGKTYTVECEQAYDDFGTYTLSVGTQKPTVDLTQFTLVSDCIEFIDQSNVYTYKASVSGTTLFQLAQMKNGFNVSLKVYDALGNPLKNTTSTNGSITVELEKNNVYTIKVSQYSEKDFGTYDLQIWPQKTTTDIAKNYIVNDSIEYKDQINIYSFTPSVSGNYTVSLSGMNNSLKLRLDCLDDLDYSVASGTYTNGKSVTLKKLTAGKTYRIQIIQNSNTGNYTMTVQ